MVHATIEKILDRVGDSVSCRDPMHAPFAAVVPWSYQGMGSLSVVRRAHSPTCLSSVSGGGLVPEIYVKRRREIGDGATAGRRPHRALAGSGFELRPNGTLRFWARTGCAFDPFSASGTCDTGDCGGALRCTVGGSPPVTLAEFTLAGPTSGDQDFYDVSLVDGYNVGVAVRPSSAAAGGGRGGGGNCRYTGCAADVNAQCPAEWRVTGASGETVACRSACEAFRAAEYCCTGAHSSPASCGPSRHSQLFKAACPAAYSYAYDDVTSTFTCAAGTAGYIVTFCPSSADAKS
ncbi:hypothetical protein B296_00053099 [Ensete ventricosum]|uniref:Thaumatin-like protein n=1 Tax=Ensete ventricosum TaxID=4639 RepID=A0A426X3U5_ENSVE|nr:hypothetical protein B296_00053099 [Ensete ventricosum]